MKVSIGSSRTVVSWFIFHRGDQSFHPLKPNTIYELIIYIEDNLE